MADNWCGKTLVPLRAANAFEEIVSSLPEVVVSRENHPDREETSLWLYFGEEPDKVNLAETFAMAAEIVGIEEPDWSLERLPDIDWVVESQKGLPPVHAGRFYIHASHNTEAPPANTHRLLIEATTAFGTGQHETTKGCLLALDRLLKQRSFSHVLDMGCGSGILGMAVAKAIPCQVLGVDNHAPSIRVANENACLNQVADRFHAKCGDGYKASFVSRPGGYDLIMANILARPLCLMAKNLKDNLGPGGVAVLSGLMAYQISMVLAAHRAHGLYLQKTIRVGNWVALIIA